MEITNTPITQPETPEQFPQMPQPVLVPQQTVRKFPWFALGTAAVIALGIGAFAYVTYTKPTQTNLPTPTPTPIAATKSGWLVKLIGGEAVGFEATGYVLLDERGNYLGDASIEQQAYTEELTDKLNLKEEPGENSSVRFSLSQDNQYLTRLTSTWGPANKPEVLEIAPNSSMEPVFSPLITREGVDYIANLGNNTHLVGIFSEDPKCDGICPGFAQFELITNGIAKKVGSRISWSGSLTRKTFVSDRYVLIPTYWEGAVDFYLYDRTAQSVVDLSKQFQVKQDDYYSMSIVMDTQLNIVYYVSEQTAKQIVISQFDIASRKSTALGTFKEEKVHMTEATSLHFSPSKKYLYLTVTNTSNPETEQATLYAINIETKKTTSNDVNFGGSELFTNKSGQKALIITGGFPSAKVLNQVDFTNEAIPVMTEFAPKGLPYAFEEVQVLGFRE